MNATIRPEQTDETPEVDGDPADLEQRLAHEVPRLACAGSYRLEAHRALKQRLLTHPVIPRRAQHAARTSCARSARPGPGHADPVGDRAELGAGRVHAQDLGVVARHHVLVGAAVAVVGAVLALGLLINVARNQRRVKF